MEDIATGLIAQQHLAGREVKVEDTDKMLKNLGLNHFNALDMVRRATYRLVNCATDATRHHAGHRRKADRTERDT